MECQFPYTVTFDVNAACERRYLGFFVFPAGDDAVSQQGDAMCHRQAPHCVELNFSPSSTLCILIQDCANGYVSGNYTGLWKNQDGFFDESVLVNDSIISPQLSFDIGQLFLKCHLLLLDVSLKHALGSPAR